MMTAQRRHSAPLSHQHLLLAGALLAALLPSLCLGSDYGLDARYSFSLTTFDPAGRLGQVERASRAASLGPPIVAVALTGGRGVVLASQHSLPTPLVRDDGTARFVRISDGIAAAHSGLGADGRAVCAAAQRLAVEHAYTFGEEIPVEILLEEVSLLFQRYTMRPGSRPFGCSLLVAHVPPPGGGGAEAEAAVYRIDPSGAVELAGDAGCIGRAGAEAAAGRVCRALSGRRCAEAETVEEAGRILTDVLGEELRSAAPGRAGNGPGPKMSVLAATLTREDGLVVRIFR